MFRVSSTLERYPHFNSAGRRIGHEIYTHAHPVQLWLDRYLEYGAIRSALLAVVGVQFPIFEYASHSSEHLCCISSSSVRSKCYHVRPRSNSLALWITCGVYRFLGNRRRSSHVCVAQAEINRHNLCEASCPTSIIFTRIYYRSSIVNSVLEIFRLVDIAEKKVALVYTNLIALFRRPLWWYRNLFVVRIRALEKSKHCDKGHKIKTCPNASQRPSPRWYPWRCGSCLLAQNIYLTVTVSDLTIINITKDL